MSIIIRESVDSLCRDGADMPIGLYKQNPLKLPNNEVLSLYRYLPLILECFCTNKTLKVAKIHCKSHNPKSSKLPVSPTSSSSSVHTAYLKTGVNTHCSFNTKRLSAHDPG